MTNQKTPVQGGATEEQIEAVGETALIAELVTDPEIGERVQTILRELGVRRSTPTAADLAATPTEPGLYCDRLGNVWHRYGDGVFSMASRIRASAEFYAPFRRLEVVGSSAPASADPADEHHDAEERQAEGEDHAATVTGDREKLIDEAHAEAERYKLGLQALCNGVEFDPAELKRRAFVHGVEWAADALAAPSDVDETKLAEMIADANRLGSGYVGWTCDGSASVCDKRVDLIDRLATLRGEG
ncbi:hypothetical protein [Leucobacter japonicus]|uniref:hypothetical protein n=1 Tax=Leucobacter japonicus TaxID=1461259 RepID=UPI0006A77745|nr:hypothetical protein [Leucobacter japonicus]